jgi:hypothetical protein
VPASYTGQGYFITSYLRLDNLAEGQMRELGLALLAMIGLCMYSTCGTQPLHTRPTAHVLDPKAKLLTVVGLIIAAFK